MGEIGMRDRAALAVRRLAVDLGNFHLLHYRRVDGFLVTAKNSGTHWLRFMLSHALALQHGLPAPLHSSGRASDDFVGHPKWGRKYPQIPFIGSSHNVPSALFAQPVVADMVRSPPIVVLVREIGEAMLSHWVKWGPQMGLGLSDYARLPPPGRKDIADVWWYMDFFNRWGRMAMAFPERVLVVRYEDLLEDPEEWLRRIDGRLKLGLDAKSIATAAALADRGTLRERLDPDYGEEIVSDPVRRGSVRFSEADEAHLAGLYARHLRYAFGYAELQPGEAVRQISPLWGETGGEAARGGIHDGRRIHRNSQSSGAR
jgi:hypothetical protein